MQIKNINFEEAINRFAKVNTRDIEIIENNIKQSKAKPFVKWVGGKKGIINELLKYIPNKINNYYEPFVGGGALFFEIYNKAKKCFLSDLNIDLIITYKVIQTRKEELIKKLGIHKKKHCKEYFLKIREQNFLQNEIDIASRLIYLNKTCFNGLYRVNKKGEFNSPMGDYNNPNILDINNIELCNNILQNININYYDFSCINPQKEDFVYFDPPYHPTNNTSFTSYTKLDFTEKDQEKLRDFVLNLTKQSINIMLSNSNSEFIRDLYKKFNIIEIQAPRSVNCKADKRKPTTELLITNY